MSARWRAPAPSRSRTCCRAKLTATAISGAGWACALGATPSCTRGDGLARRAPPIRRSRLTVKVAGDAPPTLTNTATVSGGGDSTRPTTPRPTRPRCGRAPIRPRTRTWSASIDGAARDRAALRRDADLELQRAPRGAARGQHRRPVRLALRLTRTGPVLSSRAPACCAIRSIRNASARASMRPRPRRPTRSCRCAATARRPPARRRRPAAAHARLRVLDHRLRELRQRRSDDAAFEHRLQHLGRERGRRLPLEPQLHRAASASATAATRTKIGDRGTRSDAEAYNVAAYGSYRPFTQFLHRRRSPVTVRCVSTRSASWSTMRPSSTARAAATSGSAREPEMSRNGGRDRDRTCDPLDVDQVLYR